MNQNETACVRSRRAAAAVMAAATLAAGCGASPQGEPLAEAPPPSVEPRYHATIPRPGATRDDVQDAALAGARRFLATELARTGGVVGEAGGPGGELPAYVFRATVREMDADPSGKTRASVELVIQTARGGKIVGMLRGTATAYVERRRALAERQLEAIEGALTGALQRLPQLLDRLDETRAARPAGGETGAL